MGAVYQAFDTVLSEDVAIKVIRPDVLADADIAADLDARFTRELLLGRADQVWLTDFGVARLSTDAV